jgi:hypothetical protein
MSVQYCAVASQKFTWPAAIAEAPALTVAVSVTTVPDDTEVTGLPPEVTDRTVVEADRLADANIGIAASRKTRSTYREQSRSLIPKEVSSNSDTFVKGIDASFLLSCCRAHGCRTIVAPRGMILGVMRIKFARASFRQPRAQSDENVR